MLFQQAVPCFYDSLLIFSNILAEPGVVILYILNFLA